ncbi:hypothetical protein IKA92_06180 [bacterium]|nr:hypothetical protein [bacterium]
MEVIINIRPITIFNKPLVFKSSSVKSAKEIMDEVDRLAIVAKELAEKGDYEGALNTSVDRLKLNYAGFLGEVTHNPDEIQLLDYLKKVSKKSRAYQRAKFHIGRALETSYPPLAEEAHRIIKKY